MHLLRGGFPRGGWHGGHGGRIRGGSPGNGPDHKPDDQANGRGDIDLLGYIRVLHEHGYTGGVSLEVTFAKEYPLDRCAMIASEARGHMQASLQACGDR